MNTPPPRSIADWETRKTELRRLLLELLGGFPESLGEPRPPFETGVVSVCEERGYSEEKLMLEAGTEAPIPALFVKPVDLKAPAPAVLYLHCHGHQYDRGKEELTQGKVIKRTVVYGTSQMRDGAVASLYSTVEPCIDVRPCAEDLTGRGYCVLALDSLCFGERQESEEARYQELMWHGKTLFGRMLWDEIRALDYLETRRDVDTTRIGCMGFSMGAIKAWWLAALDDRVAACVAICFLTTYRAILAHGVQSLHRPFYFVPGLLTCADVDDVVSLIAPRPFLSINAIRDVGSPLDGLERVHQVAGEIYSLYGKRGRLEKTLHNVDHQFTDTMREQAFSWLDRWLGPRLS